MQSVCVYHSVKSKRDGVPSMLRARLHVVIVFHEKTLAFQEIRLTHTLTAYALHFQFNIHLAQLSANAREREEREKKYRRRNDVTLGALELSDLVCIFSVGVFFLCFSIYWENEEISCENQFLVIFLLLILLSDDVILLISSLR